MFAENGRRAGEIALMPYFSRGESVSIWLKLLSGNDFLQKNEWNLQKSVYNILGVGKGPRSEAVVKLQE